MKKFLVLFIVMFGCGIANAADPYAEAARQQAAQQYQSAHETAMRAIEYWGSAASCGVIHQDVARFRVLNMGHPLETEFAYAARAGVFSDLQAAHQQMMSDFRQAIQGFEKLVKTPSDCSYWKTHLDEAARLRNSR